MNSFRVLVDRQMVYMVAIFALLLSLVSPLFASAAQVTERSVALSSSVKSAAGVSYEIKFTSVGAGTVFYVDFCDDTPLVGQTCNPPSGFSVSSATTSSAGWTLAAPTANRLKMTGTIAATTPIDVVVDNVTNPSTAGPLYARIVTYSTDTYTAPDNLGASVVDSGSVAMSITDKIGVSGAVLESMLFCVSGIAPTKDCGGVTAPTLKLGQDVGGGVIALGTTISTGNIFTQISTNAVSGAVVNLKSSVVCGGLMRAGAGVCDIAPSQNDITGSDAEFGVEAAADTDPVGASPTGLFQVKAGSGYSDSAYYMHWVSGNLSGVSSTYGDPFLDTNDAPVNNRNMKLTFGAQINNATPAGNYSADLSLVATGKF